MPIMIPMAAGILLELTGYSTNYNRQLFAALSEDTQRRLSQNDDQLASIVFFDSQCPGLKNVEAAMDYVAEQLDYDCLYVNGVKTECSHSDPIYRDFASALAKGLDKLVFECKSSEDLMISKLATREVKDECAAGECMENSEPGKGKEGDSGNECVPEEDVSVGYKLWTKEEWVTREGQDKIPGNEKDKEDKFIHLSTKGQAKQIAKRYFTFNWFLTKLNLSKIKSLGWHSEKKECYPHALDNIPREAVSEIIHVEDTEAFDFDSLE